MQSWLVGGAADCDVVIDQPAVSARHCRLLKDAQGRCFVDDLNSTNGTYVNGEKILGRTALTSADLITLGRETELLWPTSEPNRTRCLVTIGRDAANEIVLDFPMVSFRHALVRVCDGMMTIEDLKSTNGTFVGSLKNRVTSSKLQPNDVVYFGSLKVLATRLIPEIAKEMFRQHLSFDISKKPELVLGRDPACDHFLDSPTISWHHARIVFTRGELFVEDLQSTNGTFINGERVEGLVRLNLGDVIGLGNFSFTVEALGKLVKRTYTGNVSVHVEHVAVDVPEKRLLHDISFTMLPSEFVGLMGLSGAGKSTLMGALNGYCPPTEGRVLFNTEDLYEHYEQFRNYIGYVPQDDIIHPDLTVEEALYYSARLRLPKDFSDDGIHRRIENVLAQLGLSGTESVLIGAPEKKGISGGQRKRVNLAMELLTDPSVLFLDEPTSGLSSEDAVAVMTLLRGLADSGKTILLTIHQPSLEVYRLLDNLVVLSKDPRADDVGRLVYYGPAYPDAIAFFSPVSPGKRTDLRHTTPDDVLRGLAGRGTQDWFERFGESEYYRAFVAERSVPAELPKRQINRGRKSRSSTLIQWWTLVRRSFAIKRKDQLNSAILLFQAPIIAILIALVFGQKSQQESTASNWSATATAAATSVFLLVLSSVWFGCSNSAREIVGEWAIYRRERMVNLRIGPYIASKFAVLGCICVVQCATLLGMVHLTNGLHAPWLQLYFVMLLSALVGVGIGLTVSAVARSSEMAIACLPIIILPMIILGGILQPVHEMNSLTRLFAQLMPSRWAFESAMVLESDERPKLKVRGDVSDTKASEKPERDKTEKAKASIKERDMAENFFPVDSERMGARAGIVALAGMLLLLNVAIAGCLMSRDIH